MQRANYESFLMDATVMTKSSVAALRLT